MAETFFTLNDGSPRAVMGIRRRNDGRVQTLDAAVPDESIKKLGVTHPSGVECASQPV